MTTSKLIIGIALLETNGDLITQQLCCKACGGYCEDRYAIQEKKHISQPELDFDVYFSEKDGIPVVHVEMPFEWDTKDGPRCRIYLNDGDAIYEQQPYPGTGGAG